MSVTAEATLTDVYKNKLTFEVKAYDEIEKIGEGLIERYIIDLDNFTKKMLSTKGKNKRVSFN